MPLMCISPVLHTLQFSWGRTPFTIPTASSNAGPGFFRKSAGVITSTGTGLASRDTGAMVPDTTTSSSSAAAGSSTITAASSAACTVSERLR